MVVLLWVIFLVVCKEGIQLHALLEVLHGLSAPDLFQEVEVAVDIHASSNESVPVHALQPDVSIVLLELEVDCFEEVDVRSLNGVHVLSSHLKLVKVKVLREHLHLKSIINN